MTREILDRILAGLMDDVLSLEGMVQHATLQAVSALLEFNRKTAREVYFGDRLINEKRFEVETECVTTIATQQPMAVDIRKLASILEIATELERMGDYAKGIARINLMVEDEDLLALLTPLQDMTDIALEMLVRSVRAFVDSDLVEARAIPLMDDQVDDFYNQISQRLFARIVQQPAQATQINYLQWAVHNIERMADRVTNICERTVYVVTGVMNEFENSDDEFPAVN